MIIIESFIWNNEFFSVHVYVAESVIPVDQYLNWMHMGADHKVSYIR
jgi:hypothetical protein